MRTAAWLLLAVCLTGCTGSVSPGFAKIEDVRNAVELATGETIFDPAADRRDARDACDAAIGALLAGHLRLAIECAMRTLYVGQQTGSPELTAQGAWLLAEAYGFAGRIPLSNRFAKLALQQAEAMRSGHLMQIRVQAAAWRILGENFVRQGQFEDALQAFRRAADLPAADGFAKETLVLATANTHIRAGNPQAARPLLEPLATRDGLSARLKIQALRALGDAAAASGDRHAAVGRYRHAVAEARRTDNAVEVIWGLQRLAALDDERRAAIEHLRTAVEVIERLRGGFRTDEFRTGFFGQQLSVYDGLIALLVAEQRPAEAFAVSEQSRARALRDMMANRITIVDSAASRAAREAGALQEQLALATYDMRYAESETDRRGATARARGLRLKLEEVSAAGPPAGTHFDLVVRPESLSATAEQIQAELDERTVLLEYHVLERETLLWRVSRAGVDLHRLPVGRTELRGLVTQFRGEIAERSPRGAASAASLYERLMAPALGTVPERLLIVPHDALHLLPFSALARGDRFVAEATVLSILPSASALRLAPRAKSPPHLRVLAFGNPATAAKFRLTPLPGAEREAQAVSALFPGGRALVGTAASKRRLLAEAPAQDLLHVAAHARFDDVDPMASTLYLAPAGGDDGRIEAHELLSMRLPRTSLLVLSACQTGVAGVSHGDEVFGFSRALLAGGAQSVVLTLWEVDDRVTAELMTAFYRELRRHPVAEALARAQRAVMRTHRDPLLWAAFFAIDLSRD